MAPPALKQRKKRCSQRPIFWWIVLITGGYETRLTFQKLRILTEPFQTLTKLWPQENGMAGAN
jgi:hypothetical protein